MNALTSGSMTLALALLATTSALAQEAEPPDADLARAYNGLLADVDLTDDGVITLHRIDDRLLFELPEPLIGRDMLWHSESVRLPVEVTSYAGNILASGVVQWSRRGDQVDLLNLTDGLTRRGAGGSEGVEPVQPITRAVEGATLPPIIESFPVLGEGPNGSVVIDATTFLTGDIPEFSAIPHLMEAGFDLVDVAEDRSFIASAQSFSNNIDIRTLQTFETAGPSDALDGEALSIEIGHSIVLLPDEPMTPRWFDPRVGYFTTSYADYDPTSGVGAVPRDLILRFRLEPQDPDAEISDPVQPIVFYIDRDVPERWVPAIQAGIEAWRPVFEAAGFSNAITALPAPSEAEDPGWAPEDASHSVVRWMAQPFANAMGQNVHDPRSGEVLSAHVLVWPEVLEWAQIEYLMLASALDPSSTRLPLPEATISELLKDIITHEVGHTLGLRHNFRAGSAYSIDILRNPVLADQLGPTASIMSYGRFNCVAQPRDGISDPTQRISPYDVFAIAYGYQRLPGAGSPAEEAELLDSWIDEQITNPWLAFGGEEPSFAFDPTVGTESIGQDRIEATRLCAANMQRALSNAPEIATGSSIPLSRIYTAMLSQHVLWLMEANLMVGGMIEDRSTPEPGAFVYLPPSRDQQREAVTYVLTEGLGQFEEFLDPNLVLRLGPTGHVELFTHLQERVLEDLLSGSTLSQLHMQSILLPNDAYPVGEFVADVTQAVWRELGQPQPEISALRQALQQTWLDRTIELLAVQQTAQAELGGSVSYGALQRIRAELTTTGAGSGFEEFALLSLMDVRRALIEAFDRVEDPSTRLHVAAMIGQMNSLVGGSGPTSDADDDDNGNPMAFGRIGRILDYLDPALEMEFPDAEDGAAAIGGSGSVILDTNRWARLGMRD